MTIPLAQKATAPRPGLWRHLQTHLHGLTAAHARQARFAALDARASQDTGLPPEALLAEPAYAPDLPFFLQSGFDRRD